MVFFSKIKRLPVLRLPVLLGLSMALFIFACGKGPDTSSLSGGEGQAASGGATEAPAPAAKPLPVAEENVVAGSKDGKLLLLINVFPHKAALDAIAPEQAVAALTATALNEAAKRVFQGEYANVPGARAELIELANMNEYGDADWGKMTKHGAVVMEKKDGQIVVVENGANYRGAAGTPGAGMRNPLAGPSAPPAPATQTGSAANLTSQGAGGQEKSSQGASIAKAGKKAPPEAKLPAAARGIYSPKELAKRMSVRQEFPPEQRQIMEILQERRSAEKTFKAIRPLYAKWAMDYEAVLRFIQEAGYKIVPYEEFDPGKMDQKTCYMSHDVHWNDVAAASCMMDVENRAGARSTYYIQWDMDPWTRANRKDWTPLADLAQGKHRFGLHPQYSMEYIVWKHSPAKPERNGDMESLSRFMATDYPKIADAAKYVIPDPDWPEVKVFPPADKIDNPILRDMVSFERQRFPEQLKSLSEVFGPIESSADHGSAFRRAAADYARANNKPFFDWSSSLFITREMMKSTGVKVVRDKLHEAYRSDFPYVSDNDPVFPSFDKSLCAAVEKGRSFGMLTHPGVWMRTFMPEARLYDLKLPVEERQRVIDRAQALEENTLEYLLKRTSKEIVFEDLDLYDHPRYLGNTYPEFAPERVRCYNAEYYLRSAKADRNPNLPDYHWGEMDLMAESGSVIYLPRDLPWGELKGISFKYRKPTKKGKCFFRIYKSPRLSTTIEEGSFEGFPFGDPVFDWRQAVIPFENLKFVEGPTHPDALEKGGAMYALEQYLPASQEFVYAIEVGLKDAKQDAILWFGNLYFHRPTVKGRILHGEVSPPVANLEIQINSPNEKFTAKTGSDGRFAFPVPRHVSRYEILTQYKGIWYAPTSGRYYQIERSDEPENAYVPPVRFVLDNTQPKKFAGELNFCRYYFSADRAYHYYPKQFYLYPGSPETMSNSQQEFFVEFTSNANGYIDRDRRPENPDGNFRVAILGPCYIAGHQIASQEHLAAVTEAILRFRGKRRVEVISVAHNTHIGLGSYAPFKYHVLGLKPDLVLLNYIGPAGQRFMLPDLCAMEYGYDPENPIIYEFKLDKTTGKLIHIPTNKDSMVRRANAPKRAEGSPDTWGGVRWAFDWARVDRSTWPAPLKEAFAVFGAGLKLFADESKANHAEFGLLFGSDEGSIVTNTYEENGLRYDKGQWLPLMKEVAANAGARFFNGMTRMKDFARDEQGNYIQHWKHDDHWTPAGHRAVAEALADEIERFMEEREAREKE